MRDFLRRFPQICLCNGNNSSGSTILYLQLEMKSPEKKCLSVINLDYSACRKRRSAKGVRSLFCFRDSFGHFLVTFSDASVTFFVTFLPNSFCRTAFVAGWTTVHLKPWHQNRIFLARGAVKTPLPQWNCLRKKKQKKRLALGCRKWGCKKWGLKGCLAALPGRKSAEIGLFRPFFCLLRPFPEGAEGTWEMQKKRKKAFFLRYPWIWLSPGPIP